MQAAQRGAPSDRQSRSEKVSTSNKQPRSSAIGLSQLASAKVPGKTPVGLSFSELENRLNQSWEDLVSKEAPKDLLEAPAELAMPMPSRLVTASSADAGCPLLLAPPPPPPPLSRESSVDGNAKAIEFVDAEKVSKASIFCPLCAEQGGTCPFHSGTNWQPSSFGATSSSHQHVCEAPPPSHIAHAMVDQLLDAEDASTEASSGDLLGGSVSFSDGWSELGDVNAVLLDQESRAWWSRRESPSEARWDSPREEVRSPGFATGVAVAWPAPATGSPSRSRRESSQATPLNTEHLNQILAMGFPEAEARAALAHTGQRGVDAAVAFLVDGVST